MFRVTAACVVTALAVSGCGLGSGAITAGFTDFGASSSSNAGPETVAFANPASEAAKPSDKAPAGSFETAARGALAGRDYSTTILSPEKARDLINAYRHTKGLKPLALNVELTNAAKAHARDLARWDRISHFGSDGSNPWDRVKRTGYNARVAAENVGTGQASFEEVLQGWKDSPSHNKNLLMRDANHMGVALVQDPKTEFKSFWALVLGSAM